MSSHQSDLGFGQKTLGIYLLGFVMCVVLTLIPFYSVMWRLATPQRLMVILLVSASLQFLVQVMCFLRMNMQTEQARYNVISYVFTAVVTFILIGGSIWIMFNLNYFMMH